MGEEAHGDLSATEVTRTARAERVGLGIGLLVGIPLMLVGIVGILRHPESTPITNFLRFFLGADILHDFVVAPIAVVVSFLVLRRVPSIGRAPLRAALFGSAVVIAIAWPGIRRYGHHQAPDNRSVQPLNYATSTLTVVAVVVVIAAIWLAVALVRARRSPDPSPPGAGSIPSNPR
jgi:hypothetical protein